MLSVRTTWPLAAAWMLALSAATPVAWAAKPTACAPGAAVTVQVAPLELSDPPLKPERFYPQAAQRDGASGHVVLECNAAEGALTLCAVDEETPAARKLHACWYCSTTRLIRHPVFPRLPLRKGIPGPNGGQQG